VLDFIILKLTTDEALDAVDSVLWIGNALTLSDFTDKAVAFFSHGNYRWGGAITFAIGDNFRLTGHHVGKSRVGGTEIDADDF
jgi:hypothetical protein